MAMTSKDDGPGSGDWSLESVMETLRKQAKGGSASAQVFLDESTSEKDLNREAERQVQEATRRANQPLGSASIGKVHRLARSFSVQAAPEVIEEIGRAQGVRAILPSELPDVLIRPVRRKEE
jgi:hypothetical protein